MVISLIFSPFDDGGVPANVGIGRGDVVQAFRDTFAATQRGDALLAPKTFQYDADLLFRRMQMTGLATDIPDRPLHRCVRLR